MSAAHEYPRAASRPVNVPPELVIDWNILNPPRARELGPHLAWKELHKGPDIVWTEHNGGHWIVTRGEDIDFLQRNHDPFSMKDVTVPHGIKPMRMLPLESDPPEHTEYRNIVTPWFTPKNIEGLAGFTRDLTANLVKQLKPKGECEFYHDFSLQVPIAIFCKLTGVPASDKEKLLEWTEWSTRSPEPELRHKAHINMIDYIQTVIADRRKNPGADIMTDVVNAKVFGKPISDADITSMMQIILFGGLDTVASSMSFIANFLATHPEHVKQLIAKPEILPHAIDEMLRRHGVSGTTRTLTRDYDYKGLHFKEGDKVFVPAWLYGLDERQFDNPLDVDFSRKNVIHAGFGAGPHRCPGSYLARVEIKIFLEEWLKEIPVFGIKPGEQVSYVPGMVNCVERVPLSWPVK